MDDDLISVREIAVQHGVRKQSIFKILARLGIRTTKHRNTSAKNQMVSYITEADLKLLRSELLAVQCKADSDDGSSSNPDLLPEVGAFYLIQLEPQYDPGRFKVGFAAGMTERLRQLRCSAPFAKLIRQWPCQRVWEKTAIDAVSLGCERLHTKVFRAESLDDVIAKCEKFFAVMPRLIAPQVFTETNSAEQRDGDQATGLKDFANDKD